MNHSFFTHAYWVQFWSDNAEHAIRSSIRIGGLALVFVALRAGTYRLMDGTLARLLAREEALGLSEGRAGRLRTLHGLLRSATGYSLLFLFGTLIIDAMGFEKLLPTALTAAGVLGVGVGFGSQKLVRDVLSGFFLIVDNVFVVGDMVSIGGITGQVQDMGMRMTRILDSTGRLYIMANGDIGTVTNLSRHPVQDYIEVNIAATADLNRVIGTIRDAGAQLFSEPGHRLLAAPTAVGITAFSAASITVRVAVVSDPGHLPDEQMRVRGAMRGALLAADLPLA